MANNPAQVLGPLAHVPTPFDNMLTNVIGLNQAQLICAKAQGLTFVDELLSFDKETLLLCVHPTGPNVLTAKQKMKLKALYLWGQEQAQVYINKDNIDILDFTDEVCREVMKRLAKKDVQDNKKKDSHLTSELKKFNGKIMEWSYAKKELLSYLGSQYNENCVPLSYVIRVDTEQPVVLVNKLQSNF